MIVRYILPKYTSNRPSGSMARNFTIYHQHPYFYCSFLPIGTFFHVIVAKDFFYTHFAIEILLLIHVHYFAE